MLQDNVVEVLSIADLLRMEVLQNEGKRGKTESAAKNAFTNENNLLNDKQYFISMTVHDPEENARWMFRV